MSQIGITGFPNGTSVDVKVPSGDEIVDASWNRARSLPTENMVGYVKNSFDNDEWEGVTTTVSQKTYNNTATPGVLSSGPLMWRREFSAASISARQIKTSDNGGYNYFDQATKALYVGATANVYRINNGTLDLVRSSEITDARVGAPSYLAAVGSGTTTYQYQFSIPIGYDSDIWFGVAAIDGSDNVCNIAFNGTAYTTPSSFVNDGIASNTTITDPADTTIGVGSLAAPASVSVSTLAPSLGSTVEITWSSVASAAGYAIYICWYDPADMPSTYRVADEYIELANDGGAALSTNDVVIVDRLVTAPSKSIVATRVQNNNATIREVSFGGIENVLNGDTTKPTYEFKTWGGANEAKPSGKEGDLFPYYLEITVPSGFTGRLTDVFWIGALDNRDNLFYHTPESGDVFKWRMLAKASENVTLNLDTRAGTDVTSGVDDHDFSLTTSWSDETYTHTVDTITLGASPTGTSLDITTSTSGCTIQIALLNSWWHDQGDYNEFYDYLEAQFPAGSYCRDHSWIKTGEAEIPVETYCSKPTRGGLYSLLRNCKTNGLLPWIQWEWWHTKEEWEFFADYMCAPAASGTAGSDLRVSQGQSTPWIDEFSSIWIEFGNEAWNNLSEFVRPPSMTDDTTSTSYSNGAVYGKWCRMIVGWLEATTYWDTSKITWYIGGWFNGTWNEDAMGHFGKPCASGYADYNGGWDEGQGVVQQTGVWYQSTAAVLSDGVKIGRYQDFATFKTNAIATALSEYGVTLTADDLEFHNYEAGPGYAINGLNGDMVTDTSALQQIPIKRSRVSGTATVDTFLRHAVEGGKSNNFFTVSRGKGFESVLHPKYSTEMMPSHQLVKILHEQFAPCKVQRVLHIIDTDYTFTAENQSNDTQNQVEVYVLQSNTTPSAYGVVVLNRRIDLSLLDTADNADPNGNSNYTAAGSTTTDDPATVQLRTTWTTIGAASSWRNEGNFREHNHFPVGRMRYDEETTGAPAAYQSSRDYEKGEVFQDGGTLYRVLRTYTPSGTVSTDVTNGHIASFTDNGDATYADSTSVSITIAEQAESVPADPSILTFSVDPGGCQIWKFTGVS